MISRTESEIMDKWKTEYGAVPMVTVCCLAYNHENYIERALDGFLIQDTDFPFEVFIHDDASPDQTAEIIRGYEKKYPHIIRAVYETENQYSKRNGIMLEIIHKYLRGKYVALCEGDDYWIDGNKLQMQVSFMETHKGYAMTCHAINCVRGGNIDRTYRIFKKERDIPAEMVIEGGGSLIPTVSMCYKNECGSVIPKFRKMALVGDYPLRVLLAISGKVHYFPDIMSNYEVCSVGSWSERNKVTEHRAKHDKNAILWLDCFDEYSGFLYHTSVKKQIFKYHVDLYFLGYINKREIKKMVFQQYDGLQRIGKMIEFHVRRMVRCLKKSCPGFHEMLRNFYIFMKKARYRREKG